MFINQNHAAGGGNGSIMVGMFVCLCLASQKPSEWEFFVPARTNLGVKLLMLCMTLTFVCQGHGFVKIVMLTATSKKWVQIIILFKAQFRPSTHVIHS